MLNGNVLSVNPAPEPNDIVWRNLEFGFARYKCNRCPTQFSLNAPRSKMKMSVFPEGSGDLTAQNVF